jgi:hypothetical protein
MLHEFAEVTKVLNLELIITNQFKNSSSQQRNSRYDNCTRRQYGHHAKLGHELTRCGWCWPGTGPTPRTNHLAKHRAKAWKE